MEIEDSATEEDILRRYINYINGRVSSIREIEENTFFDMVEWNRYNYQIERNVDINIPKI